MVIAVVAIAAVVGATESHGARLQAHAHAQEAGAGEQLVLDGAAAEQRDLGMQGPKKKKKKKKVYEPTQAPFGEAIGGLITRGVALMGDKRLEGLDSDDFGAMLDIHAGEESEPPANCPGKKWVEGLSVCLEDDTVDSYLACIGCQRLDMFKECDVELGTFLRWCEACARENIQTCFGEACALCQYSPKQLYTMKQCDA